MDRIKEDMQKKGDLGEMLLGNGANVLANVLNIKALSKS